MIILILQIHNWGLDYSCESEFNNALSRLSPEGEDPDPAALSRHEVNDVKHAWWPRWDGAKSALCRDRLPCRAVARAHSSPHRAARHSPVSLVQGPQDREVSCCMWQCSVSGPCWCAAVFVWSMWVSENMPSNRKRSPSTLPKEKSLVTLRFEYVLKQNASAAS